MIKASKIINKERGEKKNTILEEKITSDFAFATVVSIKLIKKGEILSGENIWVKRPGTGEIKAKMYYDLIGKKATREIKTDEHLKFSDISD